MTGASSQTTTPPRKIRVRRDGGKGNERDPFSAAARRSELFASSSCGRFHSWALWGSKNGLADSNRGERGVLRDNACKGPTLVVAADAEANRRFLFRSLHDGYLSPKPRRNEQPDDLQSPGGPASETPAKTPKRRQRLSTTKSQLSRCRRLRSALSRSVLRRHTG